MIDGDWIKSPTARRLIALWTDSRPAWLWSADGETLLWRNLAAHVFNGKSKKSGIKLSPDIVPIKGQVARLLRLGSIGRSSLARIQFLAGKKPVSATGACTPLPLPDGEMALLIVGVDPVEPELFDVTLTDEITESLLPGEAQYLLLDAAGAVLAGTPTARALTPETLMGDHVRIGERDFLSTRFPAGPDGAILLLVEPMPAAADTLAVEPVAEAPALDQEVLEPIAIAPELPTSGDGEAAAPIAQSEPEVSEPEAADQSSLPEAAEEPAPAPQQVVDEPETANEPAAPKPEETELATGSEGEPQVAVADPAPEAQINEIPTEVTEADQQPGRLTTLFDQLANDAVLYTPIDREDDDVEIAPPPTEPEASAEITPPSLDPSRRMLYRLVGRGFTALEPPPAAEPEPLAPIDSDNQPKPLAGELSVGEAAAEDPVVAAVAAEPAADRESVERVSRYNFDELSRILNDRISGDAAPQSAPTSIEAIIAAEAPVAAAERTATPPEGVPPVPATATGGGSLINLGGETLVLNRLPLGILVFRDQQVLFANRAITEMIGYDSVENLRNAGLAAIFPAAGDDSPEAGPVNHLVQRDGTLVPVTARLQSISWQGRPALMLSASTTEVRTGHEGAVRAFAETLAETRGDGFIGATRNGIINLTSPQALAMLKRTPLQISSKPLAALIDPADHAALKSFLERPARFAETARPALSVRGAERGTELMLFAQGQAGIVTGYFGFVHQRVQATALPPPQRQGEIDPGLLGRLSRGIRRPLNTIIGFSELLRSVASGAIDSARNAEYAQDIKTAGQEIAALVDELEDFARLRDGRYAARPTDLDLVSLLDSCVVRVRSQASAARVLVRSGISESLPRIRADRASLAQAILNLLASAVDQTPPGGSVVLSAQREDDGSISMHVRDSGATKGDMSERFVVFRDGIGRNGEPLSPVRSSVGLALTRSLLTVNGATLSVDPAGSVGTLFSMLIPASAVTLEVLPPPVEEEAP
ncbi:MAG TPA: histidine kinase dimerization/phospho-acceptor domain-containing protein [Devosiaceae bacterium]